MPKLSTLMHTVPPFIPAGAEAMVMTVELAPGDPGRPPHRHTGPVFGYLLEGELVHELEGEPERVIRADEAFLGAGRRVIHYQAANNLADGWTRFVVVMLGVPGQPMLTLVGDDELAERRDRRAPRPTDAAGAGRPTAGGYATSAGRATTHTSPSPDPATGHHHRTPHHATEGPPPAAHHLPPAALRPLDDPYQRTTRLPGWIRTTTPGKRAPPVSGAEMGRRCRIMDGD